MKHHCSPILGLALLVFSANALSAQTASISAENASTDSGSTAVKGNASGTSGTIYGLIGTTDSPFGAGVKASGVVGGGADLVLDGSGSGDTILNEGGIYRDSPTSLGFHIVNQGGGMTLFVNGDPAVTTATDQDTLGSLSCSDTEIAQWDGASWVCAAIPAPRTSYSFFAPQKLNVPGEVFIVPFFSEKYNGAADGDTWDTLIYSTYSDPDALFLTSVDIYLYWDSGDPMTSAAGTVICDPCSHQLPNINDKFMVATDLESLILAAGGFVSDEHTGFARIVVNGDVDQVTLMGAVRSP